MNRCLLVILILSLLTVSSLAAPASGQAKEIEILSPTNGEHLEVGPINIVVRISRDLLMRSALVNVYLDDAVVKGFTRSELASNLTEGEQFLTFTVAANLEKAGEHTIWVASYTIFMGETGSDKIVVVGTVTTSPPTNQTSPGLPIRAYKIETYKIVLSGVVKGYVDGEIEEVDGVLYCWRAEPSLPYEGNSNSNQSTAFLRGGIFGGVMKVGDEAYWVDDGSVLGHTGLIAVKLEGEAKALFLMSRAEAGYRVEGLLKAGGLLGSFKGMAEMVPLGYHIPLSGAG